MILYYADVRLVTGIHKPKMQNHAGQEWETATIYINEKAIKCYLDKRLGANIYFQINGKWHFVRMSSQHTDKKQYSFNPINQTVKFKIKNK